MASPKLPPSYIWSSWKAVKGTNNAALTVPDADLRGKWVLITGANNGIGREATIRFAKYGANIILACRQPPSHEIHPEQVIEECREAAGKNSDQAIEWWECDMADLSSVTALAERWNSTGRPLDILANNAGIGAVNRVVLTKDGFEVCHQINLLSHALLTLSLLPSVAKASNPRIICTTSCVHYWGQFDLSNANAAIDGYSNNKLYFQVWLSELQLRLLRHSELEHIAVHGVHPGFVKTGIFRPVHETTGAKRDDEWFFWILSRLLGWIGVDSQQGSLAIVNAATAAGFGLQPDSLDEFRGGAKYFNRLWPDDPSPYTRDAASRKKVWDFIIGELESSGSLGAAKLGTILG